MKGKIIFTSISFICLLISSCQNSDQRGLVVYYPLDGDIRDLAENSSSGRIVNAVPCEDRFGRKNHAYFFNGTSAYIVTRVKHLPAVDQTQTISWWFKIEQPPAYADSMGADNMIALVDTAAGIGVQTGYRGPGYHTDGLDTWYWGGRTVLEEKPPALNQWHQCVYVYEGSVHRFYLDGRETTQSTVQTQSGVPNICMLGNYPSGDQFFEGSLDDIRIYNRVLSLTEIENLYNAEE